MNTAKTVTSMLLMLALSMPITAGGERNRYKPSLGTIPEETNQAPAKPKAKPTNGFLKLAISALTGLAAYELYQQGRGSKSYLGNFVNAQYEAIQPKLFTISDNNKKLPLQIAQFSSAAIFGAAAVSFGISGLRDLTR